MRRRSVLRASSTRTSGCLGASWWRAASGASSASRASGARSPRSTEACYCGIYGVRDAEHAAAYLTNDLWRDEPLRWPLLHRAIGRVSLWGSVVECKQGWRASHAYPERIYLPTRSESGEALPQLGDLAAALSAYGVPVKLIDGDLSMVGALVGALKARAAAQAG